MAMPFIDCYVWHAHTGLTVMVKSTAPYVPDTSGVCWSASAWHDDVMLVCLYDMSRGVMM